MLDLFVIVQGNLNNFGLLHFNVLFPSLNVLTHCRRAKVIDTSNQNHSAVMNSSIETVSIEALTASFYKKVLRCTNIYHLGLLSLRYLG